MKKTLLSAAALLASAEARGRFRPRQVPSDWAPARQTLAAMDMFADQQAAAAPQPTSAPDVPDFLLRRDRDHTCGYISGEDDNPITCPGTATCVVNTRASVAGCCGAKCNVPTVCLPQASSAQGSTADASSTLWCSGDDLPACATITYLDPQYSGYAGYFCDVSATLYPVYYSAFAAGVTSSRSSSSSSSSTSSGSSTSPTPNSTPGGNSGDSSPTPAPSSGSSGPPVGAIVGGVVGGVAAIGLIGLAVFFLIRASKSRTAHGQPPPPATGPIAPQPTGPPPPGMVPYSQQSTPGPQMAEHANLAPGAAAYDPRHSVAKSPYEASVLSSPGSPPPPDGQQGFVAYQPYNPQQQQQPPQQMSPQNTGGWGQGFGGYGPQPHHLQQNPTGGSISPQGTGYSGAAVPPAGYAPAPGQPHGGYTAELPAERGDRELQELA